MSLQLPIKYSSEVEMCREVTMFISGIITPTRHRHIPEVPRSSGNNHLDMLFIKENGAMFGIEYKLSDLHGLRQQVQFYSHVVGIINRPLKDNEDKFRIFQFTGKDWEIENLSDFIMGKWPFGKKHYKEDLLSIYWWGYKKEKSSLEGGLKTCIRKSFFEVYKDAIKNLQEDYNWNLDLYQVFRILGFYELSTTKKYFNEVMLKRGKSE